MANMAATQTELLKHLADLQQKLNTLASQATAPTSATTNTTRNRKATDNQNYCWTHGYRVGKGHTSATCNTRAPGHQEAATRADPMGGSTANKRDQLTIRADY